MLLRLRSFAFLLISLFAFQAVAGNDVAVSLYERWENLPGDLLLNNGHYYRNVSRQPDSAMVCYSIVANRYYTHKLDHDDIERSIKAMVAIAWLYQEYFYDYAKAVEYNLKAKELAEKHKCYNSMPYIISNEALTEELLNLKYGFHPQTVSLYKQAFDLSLKQQNWDAMYDTFINLMLMTVFQDKESMIEHEMDIIKNAQVPDSLTHYKFARCMIDGVRAWNNQHLDSAGMYFVRLSSIAKEQETTMARAHKQIIANTFLRLYFYATHQNDKALTVTKENERIASDYKLMPQLIASYQNLMEHHRIMKDTIKVEHYRMLALEKTVEMLTDKKLSNVKEAKFLYELNKKNDEVRALAAREQMKSRMMWGALAFSILLLVVSALLWLNYRRVQERNHQLYNNSLEMLRADEEKRQLIEQLQQTASAEQSSPYAPVEAQQHTAILDEARQNDLLHRVFIIMETNEEIFSPDFTLPRLAELLGENRNYVSEAINQRYHDHFNGLLNEYRIKEACRRFNDRANYGNLTIEAIGQSVGFKSRSGFSTIFKQITGLTPSAYQRQSRG